MGKSSQMAARGETARNRHDEALCNFSWCLTASQEQHGHTRGLPVKSKSSERKCVGTTVRAMWKVDSSSSDWKRKTGVQREGRQGPHLESPHEAGAPWMELEEESGTNAVRGSCEKGCCKKTTETATHYMWRQVNPVSRRKTVFCVIQSGWSGANYILKHKKGRWHQKQEKATLNIPWATSGQMATILQGRDYSWRGDCGNGKSLDLRTRPLASIRYE